MKIFFATLLTGSLLLAANGPASAQPAQANTNPDAPSFRTPLDLVKGDYKPLPRGTSTADFSAAEAINAKYDAYSLLIWHKGAVVLEKYWNNTGPDTRAESASMHKSVMVTLLGTAIANKSIGSVDDSVGKYIPEWKSDPRGKTTIRQTLSMATGLSPLSTDGGPQSENARFAAGIEMRALTLGRTQLVAPGTVFDYRNQNSQLAGYIIEAATKKRYAELLSQKIWAPIGAQDAYVWLDKENGMARTSGSLFARPEDWLRFGVMLKDGGVFAGKRIVPAAWIDEITKPSAANPSYGMQIWRATPFEKERYYNAIKQGAMVPSAEPWADPDIFFFDGFGGQRVYISRKYDLVIARLGRARPDWDDTALPNAVISAITAAR
ncbi:MAG: serine hydrolase [Rhodospirillaceae bacterium]|nr:serine hydrolase [Rhodospirillaceae bacterium]